jgi:hypothetical protein
MRRRKNLAMTGDKLIWQIDIPQQKRYCDARESPVSSPYTLVITFSYGAFP